MTGLTTPTNFFFFFLQCDLSEGQQQNLTATVSGLLCPLFMRNLLETYWSRSRKLTQLKLWAPLVSLTLCYLCMGVHKTPSGRNSEDPYWYCGLTWHFVLCLTLISKLFKLRVEPQCTSPFVLFFFFGIGGGGGESTLCCFGCICSFSMVYFYNFFCRLYVCVVYSSFLFLHAF